MDIMNHGTYHYHGSKHVTRPRTSCFNVKGVELEIADDGYENEEASVLLDELIEENIITVPCNEYTEKNGPTIACEDDSSVFKELVFKASSNRRILEGIKKLERLQDIPLTNENTSCHIHINNNYLYDNQLTRRDIVRSAEFLAPILFKISGRNYSAYHQWAKSELESEINIRDDDLYSRAIEIERRGDDISSYGRYRIVNLNPSNSTEIRIFSNYFKFNYDYIKLYLETVDFIIELALFMKNKNYVDDYNEAINLTKNFFEKRRYKKIYEKHELKTFFASAKERKINNLKKQIEYIEKQMNLFKREIERYNMGMTEQTMQFIRILRNYYNRFHNMPHIKFNINKFDMNEIKQIIIDDLNSQIETIEISEE